MGSRLAIHRVIKKAVVPQRDETHSSSARFNRRLVWAATAGGALVVALAGAAITVHARVSVPVDTVGRSGLSAPPSRTVPSAPYGTCPVSFSNEGRFPAVADNGPLVPARATGANLCTYWSKDDVAEMPLTASRALVGDVSDLVSYLNALPVASFEDHPTRPDKQMRVPVCAFMHRPAYRIVLTHADRTESIVEINPNCGTAARDGVVRRVTSFNGLLAFWPT